MRQAGFREWQTGQIPKKIHFAKKNSLLAQKEG
jgi:hypothetical protein